MCPEKKRRYREMDRKRQQERRRRKLISQLLTTDPTDAQERTHSDDEQIDIKPLKMEQ